MSAVLEARELRVDTDGVAVVDGLALCTTADHVLVLGAARALFEAAAGLQPVARGSLTLLGEPAARACAVGVGAAAAHEPPVPPSWSPLSYVTWSARLAGHSSRAADELARDAIARLRMQAIASAPLGRLAPHARRATVIAAALATGARLLLLDDPLGGLPDDAARPFARALAKGLSDRAWIVFAPRVPLESPLALEADEAIVVAGSAVVSQGAPAELAAHDRKVSVRVQGNAEELARRAEGLGARVDQVGAHMAVDLGDKLRAVDLLGLALESDAVIVELRPISAALR